MSLDLASFYSRTRDARKIIVVDLGFLGDSVHLVPALWALRENYPNAQIHTLSAPVGSELLAMAPCVDRAWAFPLAAPSPPWWRHWGLIRQLRRQRFNLAFNFSGADRTVFLTALMGARWKVAHRGSRKHFWSPWLVPEWVPRANPDLPVYEQRRQVLSACGLPLNSPRWDLRIPAEAIRKMESRVPAGAIHFSINASGPLKEWPLEHWIELARQLLVRIPDLRVAVSAGGSPREQARWLAFKANVAGNRLAPLPPGPSIAELAAALQRCCLHVGADSGVLHLAMALGLPTVSLFRDYHDVHSWIPVGPAHRVLRVPCECVNQRRQPCAAKARAECLAQLQPATVGLAVRELLQPR